MYKIKAKNESIGHYWFSNENMKAFGTKIHTIKIDGNSKEVIDGHYFIVKNNKSPYTNKFSLCYASDKGDITTIVSGKAKSYCKETIKEIRELGYTVNTCEFSNKKEIQLIIKGYQPSKIHYNKVDGYWAHIGQNDTMSITPEQYGLLLDHSAKFDGKNIIMPEVLES